MPCDTLLQLFVCHDHAARWIFPVSVRCAVQQVLNETEADERIKLRLQGKRECYDRVGNPVSYENYASCQGAGHILYRLPCYSMYHAMRAHVRLQ